MSKKRKKKIDFEPLKQAAPYFVAAVLTLSVALVGSLNKRNQEENSNLDTLAMSEYGVSVDQLSELYTVADLSDALGLASAEDVASNYVAANTMYTVGQATGADALEKPTITDAGEVRGVIEHVVVEGETMESIAAQYGVSTDQIRWSNGLKTTAVSPGMKLYVPSSDGIVYLVKAEDTLESIATRYGSNVEELVTMNDLELTGISEGMRIIVKGGALPEQERPEYVAPMRPVTANYGYTYLGSAYNRLNITIVHQYLYLDTPYMPGQCTSWAWYKRPDLPRFMGNAANWAYAAAAAGFRVDHIPEAGAVFQNGGGVGHVGYVEAVNADGSIVVTEMNYNGVAFRVIRSTIPASQVGSLNYIH